MSHNPEHWCKIWRKTDLLFQKWQEFGEIWPEHSKCYKTCTFICSYCAKYLMFDLKKYRGVIFHDTEGWCKIWRKTDLWLGKWHEEYGKFLPEQLKVSKIFILMCSFWAKYILFELKKYRGVVFHETEERYKIWRGVINFKINVRNLTNFDLSTRKSEKFSL